ncbi:MAG: hypothetical protein ACI4EG_12985 [Fusicatenibacter sp.]
MVSTARKIMDDDVIVLMDGRYEDLTTKIRCHKYFSELCEKKKIQGRWEDSVWRLNDGVNYYKVCFDFDYDAYMSHGWKFIRMQPAELEKALRTYAVWCMGEVVFGNISRRIRYTIEILGNIGERNLKMKGEAKVAIEDFLYFIGTPSTVCRSVVNRIMFRKHNKGDKRVLKPMLIYLMAAEKSKEIMQTGSLEEKLKYFPVYLLSNLGPRLPLRATEWTLLPYQCLNKDERGYILTVRRTDLKGCKRQVAYDVEGDYKLFPYRVPDTEEIRMMEWYIDATKNHERKYLFDYDETMLRDAMRGRFCTQSLNRLICEFFSEYLQGGDSLRWAMSVCGIQKMEPFTAGDMRPLALINLYFCGASLDVCMELADHENLETTCHYIGNIKEVLESSAVMKIKRRLDGQKTDAERLQKNTHQMVPGMIPGCTSKKRRFDPLDLSDCPDKCVNEKSCVGCGHYNPTEEEVLEFVKEKEGEIDEAIEDFRNYVNNHCCSTLDRELIRLQKAHEAYEDAYEMKVETMLQHWKSEGGYYGI